MRPFTLHVSDATLQDLRARLERVRWPDEPTAAGDGWQYGTDLGYMRELVAYWQTGFDWQQQEARLNAFPQFTARIADIDLHFIHVQGKGPNPMPLLLSHGWPGSVWEFHKVIPLLTEPDDPNDAFTVIAPSLPGYGPSFTPGKRFGLQDIGNAFAELMQQLGYTRYAAHGGDWGAFISAYLAWTSPERLYGIHLNLLPLRREHVESDAPDMLPYRAELQNWLLEETGYSSIMGTRPQTLAFGLTDSPVGLAAWIVEKFRNWSDCDGDVERRFSKDDLLTNIMLYWATGAIGSTFWPYYVRHHAGWLLPADRRVEVPTAYQSFPRDILHPPRLVAERAFNIQRWTVQSAGGHFAALEEPRALVEDVRAFFRQFRA